MNKQLKIISFIFLLLSCSTPQPPEDPTVWNKIKIDFRRLDTDGLAGPKDGKTAPQYEFCIPAKEAYKKEVQNIDPTAQVHQGRGRVGCTDGQWLMMGTTHQANYKRVLYRLGALSYIQRIEETFWE